MICYAPFMGMTIDPSGKITLCCNEADRGVLGANISEIDDLNDFFRGEKYDEFRQAMKDYGWRNLDACRFCKQQEDEGKWYNAIYYDRMVTMPVEEYENNLRIRFIEMTPSNICNQSCVMCSSYFSTTRAKVEKQIFGKQLHPTLKLCDADIDKIVAVTPGLEKLMLKGGEPFADRANHRILKSLVGTNSKCQIHIVSNMHAIPDEFLDVLSDLSDQGNPINISASIDGINDLYYWIRGTEFSKTIETMSMFMLATNAYVDINVTVQSFNFLDLEPIQDYFDKIFFANRIGRVAFSNHVSSPIYATPRILPQHILDAATLPETQGIQHIDCDMDSVLDYISKMDDVRGKRLFDIQPRLEDLLKDGYQESRN